MKYSTYIIVLLILLMVGGLGMAKPQVEIEEPIDGGIEDFSNKNAPKKIESENIKKFYLAFEDDAIDSLEYGRYIMKIEPVDNGFEMSLSFDGYSNLDSNFNKSKVVDKNVLDKLQKIVKKYDVASINGHNKRDSALGNYLDLKILYDSGETITAHGEGGCSVIPDNFDVQCFLKFFADKLNINFNSKSKRE